MITHIVLVWDSIIADLPNCQLDTIVLADFIRETDAFLSFTHIYPLFLILVDILISFSYLFGLYHV